MILRLFLVLLLFGAFSQCSNKSDPSKYTSFEDFQELVKPEVLRNFPFKSTQSLKETKNLEIIFPASIEYFGYCGTFFSFEYSEQEFKVQSESFTKSFKTFLFYDSCVRWVSNDSTLQKNCTELKPPIPKIGTGVLADFKIDSSAVYGYLNSNSGMLLMDNAYLSNKKNSLPQDWEHGSTSGFILIPKSNEIMYWLMVW